MTKKGPCTLRCVADVPLLFVRPAGGNQRELARQKAAKKQTEQSKGKRNEDGLSAAARKQRDAEIMQQKQKKANETGKAGTKSK
ncbi:small EDRK-rich factor 2-like isoform X1 [Xiphophorus couchianus]|uniref:small EDRK-rich factor 2-like isoform X1 n=1 Tax=Xiphophorus couchianus TaxID=32473 RepID=UPI0010167090|nr:small EDRK-rich factor 2-like isoform X1 [Xiphophorus couchianus]